MKSFSAGLILLSLVLLSAVQEGSGRRGGKRPGKKPGRPGKPFGKPSGKPVGKPFGKPFGKPTGCRYGICPQQGSSLPQDWQQTWEQVDNLVDVAPSQELTVEWPHSGGKIKTNSTISSGVMTERPSLSWDTEPGALYTVMMFDAQIPIALPAVFLFWMVTNIPATNKPLVEDGDEVIEYITPVTLEREEDDSFITDIDDPRQSHSINILVFKQTGRIDVEETQAGCTPDIFAARVHVFQTLAEKYNMEMVAGNFLQNTWSGYYTEQGLCRYVKCSRGAFPLTFNPPTLFTDRPECQQREELLNIIALGPKQSNREEYFKYRSRYSLVSLPSQIKNSAPDGSTGEVAAFTAIKGSYNAPLRSNNQAETLEGEVDVTSFFFPNASGANYLFGNAGTLLPSFGPFLPTLAGDKFYKLIISKPDDQDFHIDGVLKTKEEVLFMTIVEVKQGKEKEYQTMRDQLIGMYRSSKGSVASYKFDVDQEIVETLQGSPLYYSSANNEVTIFVFDSQAARERVVAETGKKFDYNKFADTFTCIMCALMTDHLQEEYYGPFESSTEVLDVTIRGPKKAQVAEYNKAISVFNPTSISSLIRETKNIGISTGVTKKFRALYGTFGATPSLEGNLASTLEGEISVEFLMYQSEQAARRILQPPEKLAAEFPDIIQSFVELAPTIAGDDFYHIIVAKPEDFNGFDVNSLITEPNSVIWMQLADVKPGKQKQFLELREKLINKIASSPFITSVYKFDVKREATDGLGPSTNARTELMMYTARSAEDQQAFIGGLLMEEPQFLMDFLSTYNCIACTALSGQLLPSYYPPFLVK